MGEQGWQSCAGLLAAPDLPHAIDAPGRDVLLVFLDPESEVGRALQRAAARSHPVSHSPSPRKQLGT